MPVISTSLGEHPGLDHAVLAGGRVEDQQRLVDRAVLLDDPLDLAELVHQPGLGVQPTGGVDQHGVGLDARCRASPRRRRCWPGRRPRARARSRRRPGEPQVCSWSAAAARKVSAAPSTTLRPSATRTRASLPQVVVLPVPLTPTTSTTAGRSACGSVCRRAVDVAPMLVTSSSRRMPRSSLVFLMPSTRTRVLSRLDQVVGRGQAHVGGQEGLLDLLPGGLVEGVAGQQREQAAAQRGLRARQAGAQPGQPAGGRLGDVELPTAPGAPGPARRGGLHVAQQRRVDVVDGGSGYGVEHRRPAAVDAGLRRLRGRADDGTSARRRPRRDQEQDDADDDEDLDHAQVSTSRRARRGQAVSRSRRRWETTVETPSPRMVTP